MTQHREKTKNEERKPKRRRWKRERTKMRRDKTIISQSQRRSPKTSPTISHLQHPTSSPNLPHFPPGISTSKTSWTFNSLYTFPRVLSWTSHHLSPSSPSCSSQTLSSLLLLARVSKDERLRKVFCRGQFAHDVPLLLVQVLWHFSSDLEVHVTSLCLSLCVTSADEAFVCYLHCVRRSIEAWVDG